MHMIPLNNQQASQELYDQYKFWKTGFNRVSNAPIGCSRISHITANQLKNTWVPNAGPNQWDQNQATGYAIQRENITRWVSRSLSQGGTVVDFHAIWRGQGMTVTFLWHFRIVQ